MPTSSTKIRQSMARTGYLFKRTLKSPPPAPPRNAEPLPPGAFDPAPVGVPFCHYHYRGRSDRWGEPRWYLILEPGGKWHECEPDGTLIPPAPPPEPPDLGVTKAGAPRQRRSSAEVKAERVNADYAYVMLTRPWLIPTRWSSPAPLIEYVEQTAKQWNARLRRNWQVRQRRAAHRVEAIKAGNGPRGWRSRQLRRTREARKA